MAWGGMLRQLRGRMERKGPVPPPGATTEMAGRSFGKASQEDAGLQQAPGSRMTFLSTIPSLATSWGQVWGCWQSPHPLSSQ